MARRTVQPKKQTRKTRRTKAPVPVSHPNTNNRTGQPGFNFGNQIWKLAQNPGRPRIFKTPEDLWEGACKYFDWVHKNPLMEEKIVSDRGAPAKECLHKMRPFTLGGLRIFLNIGVETYNDYRKRPEYAAVCEHIEQIIREQKFEGATAGFFNHAIIARDLGLSDKKEMTGADGSPLIPPAQSDEKARATRAAMIAGLEDDTE